MADFHLEGAHLTVSGALEGEDERELREYCGTLLVEGEDTVQIDLERVGSIASICVGALIVLWIDLSAAGRKMELVVSPTVMKVLRMAGLADALLGASEQ